MRIYYVDGNYVPENQAMIPVDDLAVLRGFGICDLMRTYKGRPWFLKEHIDRLWHSADEIGLDLTWSKTQVESIVMKTLSKNPDIHEANIRIIVTGGSSPDFMTPKGAPRLLVLVTPIPALPDFWYKQGVKVITVASERIVPGAKSLSYIPAAIALKKAKKLNAVEALYVDRNGYVLEGTTSNLFAFFNGTLTTPEQGVLKGITRKVILSITSKMFQQDLRPITLEALFTADEIFISGTNKGIVPVIQVDDRIIGSGKPGEKTKAVIKQMEIHTDKLKQG